MTNHYSRSTKFSIPIRRRRRRRRGDKRKRDGALLIDVNPKLSESYQHVEPHHWPIFFRFVDDRYWLCNVWHICASDALKVKFKSADELVGKAIEMKFAENQICEGASGGDFQARNVISPYKYFCPSMCQLLCATRHEVNPHVWLNVYSADVTDKAFVVLRSILIVT